MSWTELTDDVAEKPTSILDVIAAAAAALALAALALIVGYFLGTDLP